MTQTLDNTHGLKECERDSFPEHQLVIDRNHSTLVAPAWGEFSTKILLFEYWLSNWRSIGGIWGSENPQEAHASLASYSLLQIVT